MKTTGSPMGFIKCVMSEVLKGVANMLGNPVETKKSSHIKKNSPAKKSIYKKQKPEQKKETFMNSFIKKIIIKAIKVFGKRLPGMIGGAIKEVSRSIWVRTVRFFDLMNCDITGTVKEALRQSGKKLLYTLMISFLAHIGNVFTQDAQADYRQRQHYQQQSGQNRYGPNYGPRARPHGAHRQPFAPPQRPQSYDETLEEELSFYDSAPNKFRDANGTAFPREKPPGF